MIPVANPDIGADEREGVLRVLDSGQLADGDEVRAFEREFARFCGTDHAVAINDPSIDWKREAVLLHHKTLPKLADAGILEYDPRQHDVRYTGHDGLESLLDQIHADESETA